MRRLTLLAPGILGPAAGKAGRLRAAQRLLARADAKCGVGTSLNDLLFRLFAIDSPPDGDLPIAALTRLQDGGEPDTHWWYRADPVYCHPDQDRIVMTASRSLPLRQDEADNLVAELNALVASNGWRFEALTPHRWYVRMIDSPDVTTVPLPRVIGRNIFPHLPMRGAQRAWQVLLTEIQMLLHNSPINALRMSRGQLPVNNLWLWGGGRLPPAPRAHFTHVWSNEPLALGLARLCGIPGIEGVSEGGQWLDTAAAAGEHLVVLWQERDEPYGVPRDDWRVYASEVNAAWLEPLYQALRQRELDALRLWPGNDCLYEVNHKRLRRWWRCSRSLEQYW